MTPGFPIIEYVPPGGLPPDTDVLEPAHIETELQWLLRVTLGGEFTLTFSESLKPFIVSVKNSVKLKGNALRFQLVNTLVESLL